VLFLELCFDSIDLRKVYADVLEPTARDMASTLELFQEEGRLTQHAFLGGEFHDLRILSLDRERFNRARSAASVQRSASVDITNASDLSRLLLELLEEIGFAPSPDLIDLDSVETFVVTAAIEDLAGVRPEEGPPPRLANADDAWEYFVRLSRQPSASE
jgi:hypothetical protein